jgi:hypothetical protein
MQICNDWTLDDLYTAHAVLDMYDELERRKARAALAEVRQ